MKEVRLEALGRVMLVAARHAEAHNASHPAQATRKSPAHRPAAAPAPGRPLSPAEEKARAAEALKQRNSNNLAIVLYNEARQDDLPPVAMAAVGWTVLNRMRINGKEAVDQVWGGYANHTPRVPANKPSEQAAWRRAQDTAKALLEGRIADPTGGATHYYSPNKMPNDGDDTRGSDVRGGIEVVPGNLTEEGQQRTTYRPGTAVDLSYQPVEVPGIAPRDFKFFKYIGRSKHVH